MKFEDLTPEEIEYARKIYKAPKDSIRWDDKMKILMELFGKCERTTRKWCSEKLGFAEKLEPISEQIEVAKQKQHDKSKRRFLITAAQNATKINAIFWKNILAYADFIDAEILVIPYKYHNPTSIISDNDKKDDWWDVNLLPFLTLNRHNLNDNISILSDVKIQPTASCPLQGLEGLTGDHSCVVGHPRMELKTVPTLDENKPKIMFTTGACTLSNFSQSKAGKKGEFHFSTGFAIVELKEGEDNVFFFRQVSANDKTGEFIDLFYCVKDGEVTKEKEIEAITLGDIHVEDCNSEIIDITLNNLFKKLKPKKVFLHDLISASSISHHNLKDPFLLHQQEVDGSNSLEKEINNMLLWLKQFESYDVYVVKSNHDMHVDKFLRENDWRKMTTFKNAIPYMEFSTAILKGEAPNGIIPYVINKHYPNFKCLTENDNIIVKGYLMSVHGHLGANGSKGGLQQYSRLATKSVSAHSHTIGRVGGAVSVGTSTHLRISYNKSFSSWINAHGIINRLGKFQHIVFFKTKNGYQYTTLK
jgi:hypothetical protein